MPAGSFCDGATHSRPHSQEKWKFIEPGNVEAAMQTASAIGDDACNAEAKAMLCPMLSPTAHPNSACAGSGPGYSF
jgi:hypothetical protein